MTPLYLPKKKLSHIHRHLVKFGDVGSKDRQKNWRAFKNSLDLGHGILIKGS